MSEQQLVPKPNPLFRSKSNAEVLEDFEDAKLREKYSATCTLEDNVEHIKAHLKKISKSLHGMSKSMGDYCEETQILCDLLKNFSWTVNSDDKEPIITKCANVLAQITKTQLSFVCVVSSQVNIFFHLLVLLLYLSHLFFGNLSFECRGFNRWNK
jgi:hypothetical protein